MSLIFGAVRPMENPIDDRSPTAKSLAKVSEIISLCLMMILPALIGYGLDNYLGTGFLITILGLIFGFTGSFLQLKRLVSVNHSDFAKIDPAKIVEYEDDQDDETADPKQD